MKNSRDRKRRLDEATRDIAGLSVGRTDPPPDDGLMQLLTELAAGRAPPITAEQVAENEAAVSDPANAGLLQQLRKLAGERDPQ